GWRGWTPGNQREKETMKGRPCPKNEAAGVKLEAGTDQLFTRSLNMTATHSSHRSTESGILYLAFELGWTEWKLAFTIGQGQKPRFRSMPARDLARLKEEGAKAKERFGLAANAAVCSCYEAGRDGFWLHRYLTGAGIENLIVDSASIEVNRRQRRAKSDQLDVGKLLNMLLRYHA